MSCSSLKTLQLWSFIAILSAQSVALQQG
ncbi:hypothetical protein HU200_025229 [Digitaria exilis]|uniref:Uncharacterized protein n=1 Tax=Digitaria exilis TaxID=1010633 RepID=A0A835EWL4_9POAL|nr:hypothetical protein HU200_025229 [Digitaria exilis]